ncbi:MAG: hypothetical protein ACYTBS_05375 [Planctomycetota bacterium]|jgi:hypothetical protein
MSGKRIISVSVVLMLALMFASAAKAADPSLVGWWKLDEGSGTSVVDSSGYGNDGTLVPPGMPGSSAMPYSSTLGRGSNSHLKPGIRLR